MAEPEQREPAPDELARLVEQARRAEAPPLDGVAQYQLVRAALRRSRAPAHVAPRIVRHLLGLAAALSMALLGARAFEYLSTRPNTQHVEVAAAEREAHLWLRTGDALVLARGSAIDVLAETPARRTLRLTRGAVLCDVKRLAHGQGFELVTPHARVQVRGTVFSVQVDDAHTTVQVHEGTVQVAGRALRAGDRWSSTGTQDRVDHHALFAADVRAALTARGIAPPDSEPRAQVKPPAPPTPAPASAAPAVPDPPARREAPRPAPTRAGKVQLSPEPLPPSPEVADRMLREDRAEALLELLTPYRSQPTYARVYADALRATGDFERALGAYEALSAQTQGSLRSQAGYAAAQLALGPLRDPLRALTAIERFELAAPDSPLRERASVLRIDALVALGRHSDARAAIEDYLAREPNTETSVRLRSLLQSSEP